MITEIGIVAGEIWHFLDEHGDVPFSRVVAAIERTRDVALMSLGWLAREGHVIVRQEGRELQVVLRRRQPAKG